MASIRNALMIACALGALAVAAPASAETLKLGVISPLTGGGAPWGIAAAEAMRMVAEEYNSKGGMQTCGKTYKIDIVSYDDQYKVVAAFHKALPMKSIQGAELAMTGKAIIGAERQILLTEYISTIRNGEPVVLGKFR